MNTLRPVTTHDCRTLFEWVNSPSSLAGKRLTTGPIPWENHCRWLAARLDDDATRMWLVAVDDIPAGQVRLQDHGDGWEIDIYLDPGHRGRGLAAWAVREAASRLLAERPDALVVARVLTENTASASLFQRAGFTRSVVYEDHLLFTFQPTYQSGVLP